MSEMLQIQIGQTGNRIGYQFWECLLQEHGIDFNGTRKEMKDGDGDKIQSFFQEHDKNIYKPRMMNLDLETSSFQQAMSSPLNNIFQLQNCLYSNKNSRNLWPVAYHQGERMKDSIQQCLRSQIEYCDNFSGFSLLASICGGSGSGLMNAVLQKIQTMGSTLMNLVTILAPSPNISNIVVQPYNATLAFSLINQLSGQPSIVLQNQSLFPRKHLKKSSTNYHQINKIFAQTLTNITSPFRFRCNGNITLRKIATNMFAFPRLKYLYASTPYTYTDHNLGAVIRHEVLSLKNLSITLPGDVYLHHKYTRWLTNYFIFRAQSSQSYHINAQISKAFLHKARSYSYGRGVFKELYFYAPFSSNYISTVVDQKVKNQRPTVTSLQSSSALSHIFKQINDKFSKMLRKRAYLHWYLQQGMQVDELNQAHISMTNIQHQYTSITTVQQNYEEEGTSSCWEDEQQQQQVE